MPALADFAALSFLPLHWHARIAAHLRSGLDSHVLCERLIAERPLEDGATASDIRVRGLEALSRAAHAGIDAVAWDDPAYPAALAATVDPPPLLWLRGARAALEPPSVAIVGSRAGSPYALAAARELAADLAARGVVVTSGLARGVDSAAHRGALAGGGTTVAVLGCGVDIVYPAEHAPLAAEILATAGALVSELAPGTPPQAHFFPRRNRIISGLSRAVVVIEAGEKSGSLITARCALEQGRDVLAVPGSILNGRNKGGHALLKDGAKIVETADDILEELGIAVGARPVHEGTAHPADPVLDRLAPGEPADVDDLAARTGLSAARLLPRLFELELLGLVRRAGGGRFVRI